MMRLRHKLLIHGFRLSDQVSIWLSLVVSIALFGGKRGHDFIEDFAIDYHPMSDFIGVGMLAIIWASVFGLIVRYNTNRFTSLTASLIAVTKATIACSFILLALGQVFDVRMITPKVILCQWLGSILLIGTGRLTIRHLLSALRKSGYNRRNVLFVGASERAIRVAASMESKQELGFHIQGFVLPDDAPPPNDALIEKRWPVICRLAEFKSYLGKGLVDEVMICLPLQDRIREIFSLFQLCQEQGVVFRIVPDVGDARALERIQVELFEGEYLVTFFREQMLWQLLAKRALDVIVSLAMLVLLSPLLLAVAIAIKITSPGPVLFSQERVGMNKRKFKLYKFRSMVVDAEKRKAELAALNEMDGPVFKIKNDPRITKVGRFIRKTSVDEFPQLWNVLKGEMSLVGPRPPLPSEVDQYEWLDRRRLSIKPGITCLWQVGGRNNLSFEEWMKLDRFYCEHWSFWLDIKILLKTIPVVLFGKGAS